MAQGYDAELRWSVEPTREGPKRLKGLLGAKLEQVKENEQYEDELNNFLPRLTVRTYSKPRFSTRSTMVTVTVDDGAPDQRFEIHEDLLKEHSDFFAAALNRQWKESQTKAVNLPEDDPFLFEVFANFLHSGCIYSTEGNEAIEGEENDYREDPAEWERLAHCWIMGDKLAAPWFQDAIDGIIQKMVATECTPLNLPSVAYSKTTGDNPLKRLAVDIAVWIYDEDELKLDMPEAQQVEFYRDTAARLKRLRVPFSEQGKPWREGTCDAYHLHSATGVTEMYPYARRRYDCYNYPLKMGGLR